MSTTFDLIVIGAGPAGCAAAIAAARHLSRVSLIDEAREPGGQVYRAPIAGSRRAKSDADSIAGSSLRERVAQSSLVWLPERRIWSITRDFRVDACSAAGPELFVAKQVIAATGAYERVVPFPGWTLPGVIGLAAATILEKSQAMIPGRRCVIAGCGPLLIAVAAKVVEQYVVVPAQLTGSVARIATADAPKCFAEVAGKRLLDWAVEAFRANGLDRVCFIGGYQIDKVKQHYPQFTFRHNPDWEHNNILASLFYAADLMDEPFICCYSDVLFTPDIVARLAASPDDMALGVDTAWLERYEHRTDHPPDDAEKVTVAERPRHARPSQDSRARRLRRIHRRREVLGRRRGAACASITTAAAKSSPASRGAKRTIFEKAYKILLFQDMIEAGRAVRARRYARRLHRSRYAARFRIRPAALDSRNICGRCSR